MSTTQSSSVSQAHFSATVRRGVSQVSRLWTRSPSPTRALTPKLPAILKRRDKQAGSAKDELQRPQTATLHHRSSAGNMLERVLTPSSPKSSKGQLPRPHSVNGLDMLQGQMDPFDIFLHMEQQQVRWAHEDLVKLPIGKIEMRKGANGYSARFVQLEKLRRDCNTPQLNALINWAAELKKCWAEVDKSFDDIFRMRAQTGRKEFSDLLQTVPHLIEPAHERLSFEKLRTEIASGLLPTFNRLNTRKTADEFRYLKEQFAIALVSAPRRPRKASGRLLFNTSVTVKPSSAQERWTVDSEGPHESVVDFVRPKTPLLLTE